MMKKCRHISACSLWAIYLEPIREKMVFLSCLYKKCIRNYPLALAYYFFSI